MQVMCDSFEGHMVHDGSIIPSLPEWTRNPQLTQCFLLGTLQANRPSTTGFVPALVAPLETHDLATPASTMGNARAPQS